MDSVEIEDSIKSSHKEKDLIESQNEGYFKKV